jgi:hypothetical protein
MKLHVIALTTAALLASATLATAQGYNTPSTTGQTMQQQAPAPGASSYAPGHMKKKQVARKHKRSTTGSAVREKRKTSTKSNTKY